MTRYVTRALKQWRAKVEEARLQQRQLHKTAHPGLQGTLQRRKDAIKARLKASIQAISLRVSDDKRGLVIV